MNTSEDRIFFDKAAAVAADMALDGDGGRDLCSVQAEAMRNHRMLNDQEVPFLEANGFRRCDRGCKDASEYVAPFVRGMTMSVTVEAGGTRRFSIERAESDGSRTTVARGESSRSVMDAVMDCLRGLADFHAYVCAKG